MTENYLIHYGVKGMKWGVRKKEDEPVSKGPRKAKKDEPKTSVKSKKINSDEDLNKVYDEELNTKIQNVEWDYINYYDNEVPKIKKDMVERARKISKKKGFDYTDEELINAAELEVDMDYSKGFAIYALYDRFSDKYKNKIVEEDVLSRAEIHRESEGFNASNGKRAAVGSAIVATLLAGALGATAIGLTVAGKIKKK